MPGGDDDATRREGQGARPPRSGTDVDDPGGTNEDVVAPGTQIGRYVIVDVLGAGGMGVVYSAFDPELDRKIAIKLLQAQAGGSQSAGGQAWLLREAQAMARLAHPNVVAVHDVGVIPGDRVFVAMELVAGQTLRAWLRATPPRAWRDIVAVMRAAGAGLAAAHAVGLVHRDFKPDNVLVGDDGRARVMDFGLARLGHHDDEPIEFEKRSPLSERLTQTGAFVGTPAYMAPEIYGGQAADQHADQFAFGVALYEALYRARPFARDALVEKRAVAPKPPAAAKIPPWLEKIVLRAIAIEPAARYPTMDALLAELAVDPTRGKKRLAFVAGAVGIAAAGAAFAAIALHTTDEPPPPPPPPCQDAPALLATAWGTVAARAQLETAFRAGGKPYADDAIHATEKVLDAYAKDWRDMRTEACRATRVHGSQTEAVLTLRMACLDDRLAELRTLTGAFTRADDALVLGAPGAAQKLSSLAACADVPALLAPDPMPADPVKRATAKLFHDKLVEARAIYKTSRLDDTLKILNALAPQVKELEHLPTQAELHLITGQTLWMLKGAADGEPEFKQAALDADAGKADGVKVEAWLQLTNLANDAGHFDVAKERLESAKAALARLGNNWDLKVRVLASEALLASRTTQHDRAVEVAKQARVIAEQHPDSPGYTYALLVEASILTSAGRAPDAIQSFRDVLAAQEALGHKRIDVAATLQSMAGAELAVGRIDDAVTHLSSALEIDEAIYGKESRDVAKVLSALGAARAAKGDAAGGLAANQQAFAMAEKLATEKDDELIGFLAGQVADALVGANRPKEALPYLERALAINTAKLGPGHVQTLAIMLTKCDAQEAAGSLKDALATCRAALAKAEGSLGKTSPMLFLFYAHTGMVLVDAKQQRDAFAMFEHALAIGAPDPGDVYAVALLDAKAAWAIGQHPHAIAMATKSRDGFATLGEAKKESLDEAAAWLKAHGVRR